MPQRLKDQLIKLVFVGSNPTASAKCIYNCHCPGGLGVGPQNLQHWFESNMAVIYI